MSGCCVELPQHQRCHSGCCSLEREESPQCHDVPQCPWMGDNLQAVGMFPPRVYPLRRFFSRLHGVPSTQAQARPSIQDVFCCFSMPWDLLEISKRSDLAIGKEVPGILGGMSCLASEGGLAWRNRVSSQEGLKMLPVESQDQWPG